MRFRSLFFAGLGLALVSGLAACGTTVSQDDSFVGGGPADGGGSSVGPGGSGAGGSPSASQAQACEDLCTTLGVCLYDADTCVADCVAEDVPYCLDEWVAQVECTVESFDGNCEAQHCDAETQAYLTCFHANSCTHGFGQNETSCTSTEECQDYSLQQVCQFASGGIDMPCECTLDGSYLGSCTMDGDACNIQEGCCKQLL